jgi:hypothetical protein
LQTVVPLYDAEEVSKSDPHRAPANMKSV